MFFLTSFYLNLIFSSYSAANKSSTECRGVIFFPANTTTNFGSFRTVHINLRRIKIPSRFDAREKWPLCQSIRRIKEEGKCGGCWAFAASSVIEDRFCIINNQQYDHVVSVKQLLKCCNFCINNRESEGCDRGSVEAAFHYWVTDGILIGKTSDEVFKNEETHLADEECGLTDIAKERKDKNSTHRSKTMGLFWYKFLPNGGGDIAEQIKADIFFNGPIVAFFESYKYIEELQGGTMITYNDSLVMPGETPTVHAMKIIGWDVQNGIPIWIFANSWGTKWCNHGFCTIPRGVNQLKMEEYGMIGGLPENKGVSRVSVEKSVINEAFFDYKPNSVTMFVVFILLTLFNEI